MGSSPMPLLALRCGTDGGSFPVAPGRDGVDALASRGSLLPPTSRSAWTSRGNALSSIGSRSETSTRRSRTQLRCVVRAAHAFRPAGRLAERRNGSAQRGRDVRVATTAAGRGECAARVVPAGSDDLTRNAGSTSPYGGARGCTGRYKDEVIRLDAPRDSRRSRLVDTARSGRGLARGAEMDSSRSSLVRNPIRPRLRLRDLQGRSFAYGWA